MSAKIKAPRSSSEEVTDVDSAEIPPSTNAGQPSVDSFGYKPCTRLAYELVHPRESRQYCKSGVSTRQDSATLSRGEHPLHNSMYLRDRHGSVGSPSSALSSSVPPVPHIPSRASMDATVLRNRNSGDSDQLAPVSQLKRPKSTGRLRREQGTSMPPISTISEASSPVHVPSLPNTPVILGQGASTASNVSASTCSRASLAQQRSVNLEGNASSSSFGTGLGSGHTRVATEPEGANKTKDRAQGNYTCT